MSNWDESSIILRNDDKIYGKYFQKTGTTNVDHRSLIIFGDPKRESFLREISITEHIFLPVITCRKYLSSTMATPGSGGL